MSKFLFSALLIFATGTTVLSQGYWKRVHGDVISATPSGIGTYAPGNSPLGRYASACMTDSSGNFWIYGGGQANDLWCFDPLINQWKFVNGDYTTTGIAAVYGTQGIPGATNQPGEANFGHPSWGDKVGNLWLYGLNGLNDLWKYNISSGMWTWIHGTGSSGPPSYGIKGIASPANNPGTCNETDCHWTDSNGDLWLYTEFDGNLWKFDVASEMWIWMSGNGGAGITPVYGTLDVYNATNTPGGFSACPAVGILYTMWITADDHLWMMVNRDGIALQVEMWEYNPTLNQWRCRRIDSNSFGEPQTFPAACADNNPSIFPVVRTEMRADWVDDCNRLYLFGGGIFCTLSEVYNDIWRYDPATNCYTYLRGGVDPMVNGIQHEFNLLNSPPCAAGGQAWQNENGFYLMGGQNNLFGVESNAVWLYSPDTVITDFTYSANCLDVSFTNQSTTGCNSFKQILWNFGDGDTSTLENPTHTYAANGTYTVVLTTTNCSWDTDTSIQTVTVDCGFSIALLSDTICAGMCTNLIATSSENTDSISFQWDNGISSTNDSVLVCPASTTTYTVIGTNLLGEMDTASATLTVINPPNVNLGNDTTLCGGNLILDAGNTGSTFLWQDGSINQTYNASTSGTYFVTVSNGGCSESDTVQITVNGPSLSLGPDVFTCHPNLTLNAGNSGCTYLWQDGSTNQLVTVTDTGTYSVVITDSLGCQVNDTINILPGSLVLDLGADTLLCSGNSMLLDAGIPGAQYTWSTSEITQTISVNTTGEYTLLVTDGICTATDSITIEIQSLLTAFLVSDTIGCTPLAVSFFDTTPVSGITSWLWNFGDGQTSTQQNTTHAYSASGIYNVNLQITTVNGCTSDTSKMVTVSIYDQPVAAFTFSPNPPETGVEILFEDLSINATAWYWNFGDGSSSTLQNPSYTYSQPEDYTITLLVSNESCVDSSLYFLIIEEALVFYVPNVFTPDGDAFNPVFQPVFTTGFDPQDYHLTIFNRWGQIVFESYNAAVGWDGTYPRCGLVIDDVYVWQIEFGDVNNDKRHLYRGHVTVLK